MGHSRVIEIFVQLVDGFVRGHTQETQLRRDGLVSGEIEISLFIACSARIFESFLHAAAGIALNGIAVRVLFDQSQIAESRFGVHDAAAHRDFAVGVRKGCHNACQSHGYHTDLVANMKVGGFKLPCGKFFLLAAELLILLGDLLTQ